MAKNDSNYTSTLEFKVDVGNAKQNLKAYKDYVDGLKGSLLTLEKGTDKYNEVAKELSNSQQKLNEVMDIAKGKGEAVEGSYDALSKKMSELKKQWKATGDEATRAKLGEQIVQINDKLKAMDASVGVFSRNVGNYQNAFEGAFLKLKDGLTSSIPAVKKLNSAFNLIVANPIGAVIAAVAAAVVAVTKAMKSSESQMNQFRVATAGIRTVVDGLKNALTSVSQVVVNLIEKVSNLAIGLLKRLKDGFRSIGWDKWADGMENFLNKIEDYQNLEKQEIDIEQRRRAIAVESAKVENEVAKLRAKIAEKDKYSVEQRLAFVDQWEKAEKRGAELRVQLAQAEYDAIKKRNSLTENSTKDLDAENDAYVRLIQSQTEYDESLRTINKTRATLLGQVKGEAVEGVITSYNEVLNALAAAEKREEEIRQERLKQQEETNALSAELDKELYDTLSEELDGYNDAYIQSLIDAKNKEQQILNERKEFIKTFVSTTSSIIGMVADAWESSIKSQIEAGKMSEEEGKKQFEQVKALQTSVAVINTIAGVVAALTSPTLQNAGPWGWAAAIAQSVALAAAGAAQVAKIQNTNLGNVNSQVTSVGTPNLGTIVNDIQPSFYKNITNQIETEQLANALTKTPIRAYVTESDITSKQQLAYQRNEETSW